MKIRRILVALFALSLVLTACEKEDDVDFTNDDLPGEGEVKITGTKWVAPIKDFDDQVDAMIVYEDKFYLSYLYYKNGNFALAGEYNGKTLRHHYQKMGNSSGFHRFRIFDEVLYLVGGAGFYPVWTLKKDREYEFDDYWETYRYDNTVYYDFLIHGNNKIAGTGISPYLRVFPGGDVTGDFDGAVNALVVYNDHIYAGGSFKTIDGEDIRGVAMWNGTSWKALGDGISGSVSSLAVYNDQLIILGKFEKSGSMVLNNIAAWDETEFSALGTGLTGGYNNVGDLCIFGDELLVGGDFEEAGGLHSPNVAKWNGTEWEAFPAGVPSMVGALAVYKNQLYVSNASEVGGNFLLRLE